MAEEDIGPNAERYQEYEQCREGSVVACLRQERPSRHLRNECTHHVVELPLLLTRLQLVVAIHTALLAGDGGIDRSQHRFAIHFRELGGGYRRGLRKERIDRGCRRCISWGSDDFATTDSDHRETQSTGRSLGFVELV